MAIKFPVSTPTPLYDYTLRYNKLHEERIIKHRNWQNNWQDFYELKMKQVQESHRIAKAELRRAELDQVHQYEVLDKRHAYANYQYMFYIGTKFDVYI